MKHIFNKRGIYTFLSLGLILLIFGACGLVWGWKDGDPKEAIIVENYDVKPTEEINIEMNFHVRTIGDDVNTDKLVIAVQVPAILNPRSPGVLEVTWENVTNEKGVLKPMRMLAVDEYPKQLSGGITWEQHLLSRFRDDDPNLLDGMQWVAFVAEESVTISNQSWNLTARVKIKTDDQYWRAKIGLCAYRESKGGGNQEPSDIVESTFNYINDWTQCVSVIGDEDEDILDFCYFHFNKHLPASSNQNDIVTIIFNGDVAENELLNAGDIYLNAVATTIDGKTYAITERSEKTKMTQEDEFGYTYTKTFWPEEYFGVPSNETIAKIEYYYVNSDGLKYVSLYDDKIKDNIGGIVIPSPKPVEPFVFLFQL